MQKLVRCFGLATLAAWVGVLMQTAPGVAAPQALALVAMDESTDLICRDGACSAEFSSFCLQSGRFSPMPATAYHLEGNGAIRASDTTVAGSPAAPADGSTVILDPVKDLQFQALRSHVAVRVSVSPETIRQYGLRSVSVHVGENVTLAPEAVAHDDNPQDGSSLATASGPLRSLGHRMIDTDDTRMAAARLTSRLINGLDSVPSRQGDRTDDLWNRIIGEQPATTETARQMARDALDMCSFDSEAHNDSAIRDCLRHHHDRFVVFLNTRYWEATGTGM